MNETLELIKNRRSVRSYEDKQISENNLEQIIEAGIYAPNSMNQQKWHFTIIQNKSVLDRMVRSIQKTIINLKIPFLSERASEPGYHTFYNAPTVIVISGVDNAQSIQIDAGLAAENIALASGSLDISSCVITSSSFLFATTEGEQWKQELGIPAGYSHICSLALGYKKSENPFAPPRNKDVVNYIK